MPECIPHQEVSHLHCFPLIINQYIIRMITLLVDVAEHGSWPCSASRMCLDLLLKKSACSLKYTIIHITYSNGQLNVPIERQCSRGAQLL